MSQNVRSSNVTTADSGLDTGEKLTYKPTVRTCVEYRTAPNLTRASKPGSTTRYTNGLPVSQGKIAEANKTNEQSLAIWKKGLGAYHPCMASSINLSGQLLVEQVRMVSLKNSHVVAWHP